MTYRRLQVYFFLVVFTLAMLLAFLVFRPYLALMVFSGILAVLMHPIFRRLLGYFRGRRAFAAVSTVFLTLIVVLMPLLFFMGTVATETVQLFNRVRQSVEFKDVEGTLARLLGPEQAHRVAAEAAAAVSDVASYAQPVISGLTSNVVAIFSNTFSVVLGFFLVLMGMYYFLKDGDRFKHELLDLSPLTDDDDTTIFDRIRGAIEAVAYGQFVVAILKGIFGGAVFFALGLPAPFFWGTMIAFAHFLPVVGTGLVTVPFIVYLFATGDFWRGLILTVISALVIGLVDNVVTPQLIRNRISIHPMLILLSMLGGLHFFGPLGLFFGPIVLSVTLALVDIYKKEFRSSIERIEKL